MKILERGQYKEAKVCPVCEKYFTIRKKRKDTFDSVKYCSDKCRKRKLIFYKKSIF